MNRSTILCAVLAWIALSCSTDNDPYIDSSESVRVQPENSANAYDYAGRIYQEFLESYPEHDLTSWDIEDIDKQVRSLWNNYGYKTSQYERFSEIPTDTLPEKNLEKILSEANLSASAKDSFLDFLNEILAQSGNDYNTWYNTICAYETEVAEAEWIDRDKQVILTTTSLLRYSGFTLYSAGEGEEEDEDWDVAVGNVVSMIITAIEDTPTAISNALLYTLHH
ncbi:hypothetical protein [Sinomicrobium weinanense]|uniref:Uncharacterized protein n=1 Tax=Sinomicrobium weinanense TaxID=2842200 RepID=A0A926Q156_9FLAO|nr:hypothetical protein [Sinomicrobium weinanense]MBC9795368.1 hypothetical protein [Sinomicrobium weinanense]MBU3122917.1 hypothetical protein [Sinomicrobium weinanense]